MDVAVGSLAADDGREMLFVGGFSELVRRLGTGDVANPGACLPGSEAGCDERMGLMPTSA